MRKTLFLILAVMILAASVASPLYAEGGALYSIASQYDGILKSYTVYGVDEAISTTTLVPGVHKILGYQISGNGAASFAGIYDETTLAGSAATDLISECRAAFGN